MSYDARPVTHYNVNNRRNVQLVLVVVVVIFNHKKMPVRHYIILLLFSMGLTIVRRHVVALCIMNRKDAQATRSNWLS